MKSAEREYPRAGPPNLLLSPAIASLTTPKTGMIVFSALANMSSSFAESCRRDELNNGGAKHPL